MSTLPASTGTDNEVPSRFLNVAMPRPDQPGEALCVRSVAVAAAGAGPDQAEALTILVVEE
ncbi:hypothetical protein, partial [Klebsiella pneumoniae]|uniref:hypothetical protein n=1 Tax=Klebsiella pneumoniae TaxID=573 RepID=UPI001953AE5F